MLKQTILSIGIITTLMAPPLYSNTNYANDNSIYIKKCSSCHGTEIIEKKIKTKKQWKETVKRMKRYGMKINSKEKNAVLKYLYTYRSQ